MKYKKNETVFFPKLVLRGVVVGAGEGGEGETAYATSPRIAKYFCKFHVYAIVTRGGRG